MTATTPDPARAIRKTMRLSILEGSLTQAFLNWTTGSVLIGYMLTLGATPTQIGLVGSLPLLAQISSPFAGWVAAVSGLRKELTIVLAIVGRGLWVTAALLPQLGLPAGTQTTVLVVLVAVSGLFQAGVGTLWASWMGEVVPQDWRGRYFGIRTGIVGVVGMLANLAAGWFLDRVGAPLNFQLVLATAVLTALVGCLLYGFHYQPPPVRSPQRLAAILSVPWRNPNFRRFLLFGFYWQAAVLLAGPFVFPYFLDALKMTFTQIAIWGAIAASTALVTTALWGRVADRYGNKVVLGIAIALAGSLLPLSWMAATPGNLWPIWFGGVVDAVAWGAIGPALFNLALASSPAAERLSYYAMFSLVTGVAGFLGGLLSGPLFVLFQGLEFTVRGFEWTAYHYLFTLSGVARLQAGWLLRRVEEANAWSASDVLRRIRFAWRGVGLPWRS